MRNKQLQYTYYPIYQEVKAKKICQLKSITEENFFLKNNTKNVVE